MWSLLCQSSGLQAFNKNCHNKSILISALFWYPQNSGRLAPKFVSRKLCRSSMAKSKWEYVKNFESEEKLLPNCWAVARIDGRGFHKLAKLHNWKRPNDERGLKLMTRAAKCVMLEFKDVVLGYGQSDEYSFVFRRETEVFERRSVKIVTTLVSKFSSAFAYYWRDFFPETELQYPPSFDCRVVLYPTDQNLRDYLCWRQADCHINNLYNTTFWALVLQGGLSNNDAQKELSGTLSGDKNEILFSRFGINYNNEPEVYRKGTVLVVNSSAARFLGKEKNKKDEEKSLKERIEEHVIELNCDIIGDGFWKEYPYLLDWGALKTKSNCKNERKDQDYQESRV